jgi:hypothetical protein
MRVSVRIEPGENAMGAIKKCEVNRPSLAENGKMAK